MNFKPALLAAICLALAPQGFAAIIGTNVPANPLTAGRVAGMPEWQTYFENSERQRHVDQESMREELTSHGLTNSTLPHKTRNAGGLKLKASAGWYASGTARHIADVVVSFQTPAGGWSKNSDYTQDPRKPGEMYGVENGSLYLGTNDFDIPEDPHWAYVGTFDNDATYTELAFLAKVISAAKTNPSAWQQSFFRGLNYIFAAQYPNGGWPQVWPLQGGYHDNITLNDDAMLQILQLLYSVANGERDFAFVSADVRAQARGSFDRGMNCLLEAQVKVDGKRTGWCQQYDAITLAPASARNYEMPSLASSESATIILFLMKLPEPTSDEVDAVHGGCAWFKATEMTGRKYLKTGLDGRLLVSVPGAGPLWARYYEIGTNQPIFGDRDKTVHDAVADLSKERRNGYGWYRDTPKRALEHYAKWVQMHPIYITVPYPKSGNQ